MEDQIKESSKYKRRYLTASTKKPSASKPEPCARVEGGEEEKERHNHKFNNRTYERTLTFLEDDDVGSDNECGLQINNIKYKKLSKNTNVCKAKKFVRSIEFVSADDREKK